MLCVVRESKHVHGRTMSDRVVCDCQSKGCANYAAKGRPKLVSRATWFRHKAADLLGRAFLERDENDVENIDPLHVPAGDIDEGKLAELEAAGLFCEGPEQVLLVIGFSCCMPWCVVLCCC